MVIDQSVNSALIKIIIRIEKKNLRERKRLAIDVNYRLSKNTRRRIHRALKRKSKSSLTIDILGKNFNTYKRWIEFQMTPEMKWFFIEIDHVKPICMIDVSKDEKSREAFSWKNTQPLLKEVHSQKSIEFSFLDLQLQFIRAYQYLELNDQKGLNEDLH